MVVGNLNNEARSLAYLDSEEALDVLQEFGELKYLADRVVLTPGTHPGEMPKPPPSCGTLQQAAHLRRDSSSQGRFVDRPLLGIQRVGASNEQRLHQGEHGRRGSKIIPGRTQGEEQRRFAEAVRSVDMCAVAEEKPDDTEIATADSIVKRRVTLLIASGDVHLSTSLQEGMHHLATVRLVQEARARGSKLQRRFAATLHTQASCVWIRLVLQQQEDCWDISQTECFVKRVVAGARMSPLKGHSEQLHLLLFHRLSDVVLQFFVLLLARRSNRRVGDDGVDRRQHRRLRRRLQHWMHGATAGRGACRVRG